MGSCVSDFLEKISIFKVLILLFFMGKIIVPPSYLDALAALDVVIADLNEQKIRLFFELLGIELTDADWEKMKVWELIMITVLDKQMAVQLNKLSAYMPRLKFVVRADCVLFTLLQGDKKRRIWKER